jgi:hypothetical protein
MSRSMYLSPRALSTAMNFTLPIDGMVMQQAYPDITISTAFSSAASASNFASGLAILSKILMSSGLSVGDVLYWTRWKER